MRNVCWVGCLVLAAWGCEGERTARPVPDLGLLDAALPPVGAPDGGAIEADAAPIEGPEAWTAEAAFEHVDPFIGTGGTAFGYAAETPAAQWPVGMVRLGPDSTAAGAHPAFHHFSGYHFDDPDLRGFSHTHFVGTGAPDYGNLRVLPLAAAPAEAPWAAWTPMDKASEVAAPGYYAVTLPEAGVRAELTSSLRAGLHRYTFEAPGVLLFDAAAGVERVAQAVDLRIDGATVEGRVLYGGSLTGRTRAFELFFSAVMDPPPTGADEWAEGDQRGVALAVEAGVVTLRVGLSFVDLDGARANRGEVAGPFEAVRAAAEAAWRAKLATARIAGGTEAQRTTFATALYHAYGMPTRLDDVDGRYRGLDGEIHAVQPGEAYYTDLSLWDTFRTLHPWYELVDEPMERQVLQTLVRMRADGGYFPRWPAATSYASSMLGTSADMLIAGGHAKGIDAIDYEVAFEGVLETASGPTPPGSLFGGRDGVDEYLALGYVSVERTDGSVSKTVEYAYSDGVLAEFAQRLGRPEAARLAEQAKHYEALWDPDQRLFAPRHRDGTFDAVRLTQQYFNSGPYVEGTPNHWRFTPFHDPEGLAALFGGREAVVEALDALFETSNLGRGTRFTSGPDAGYWHGNEPMLHAAWLYGLYGEPDRLARWVRAIQRVIYLPTPDGLPGNDDGGTMSAWYLLAASGLYPVAGTDRYLIGPPLFERIELQTASGGLTVLAPGASDAARHVEGVWLDGVPVEGPLITHGALLGATELRFALAEGVGE